MSAAELMALTGKTKKQLIEQYCIEFISEYDELFLAASFCPKKRAIYQLCKQYNFNVPFIGAVLLSRMKDDSANVKYGAVKEYIKLYNWGFIVGKIISGIHTIKKNHTLCYDYVFIFPEHRRQGHFTKHLNMAKTRFIYINIPSDGIAMKSLCIKNGFTDVAKIDGLLEDERSYCWSSCKNVSFFDLKTCGGTLIDI
jgi:hypothetical protein